MDKSILYNQLYQQLKATPFSSSPTNTATSTASNNALAFLSSSSSSPSLSQHDEVLLRGPSFYNYDIVRYSGYNSSDNYDFTKQLFSQRTIDVISRQITLLTQGLHPSGRPIKVTDDKIAAVLNNVYHGYRPSTGNIASRYIIPQGGNSTGGMFQEMIDQTIEIIYSFLCNEYQIVENNTKLTAWTAVLGEFNEHGLRAHGPLKMRERRIQPMQFNMRY
jgi:hypothetical protein